MSNDKTEHLPLKIRSEDAKNTKGKSITIKSSYNKKPAKSSVFNTAESSDKSDTTADNIQVTPIFLNGSFKKDINIPGKVLPTKKFSNSTHSIRSMANNNQYNIVSNILKIRNNFSLKGGMAVLRNDIRRCSSLTDSLKAQNEEFHCLTSVEDDALSFPRLALNFKHVNTASKASGFNYMEEVLGNNGGLQNPYRSSDKPKSIFSLTPKMSPIRLKKKTYGILSMNNSTDFPLEKAEESKQNEANITEKGSEREENNLYDSSSDEDSKGSDRKDLGFDGTDRYVYPSKCNEGVKDPSSSSLFIREPLRIKCIDEATKSMKEILIYSDEFLSDLQKKNVSKSSKKEIFENLVRHCMDYKGKSLRIIIDTKNFMDSLSITRKQSENHKKSISSKISNPNSETVAKNRSRTKKIFYVPSKRSSGNILNEQQSNRRENSSTAQLHRKKDFVDKAGKVKMPPSKRFSSTREHFLDSLRNEATTSIKTNKDGGRNENGRKPRIAFTRVNIDEIISSKFRKYFHFYAKFRSRLKSGCAISKMNSNFWLKTCGIISDTQTEKLADDCFDVVAKNKYILNISDFLQFLISFAKTQEMKLMDILNTLMSYDIRTLLQANCMKDTNSLPGIQLKQAKVQATA